MNDQLMSGSISAEYGGVKGIFSLHKADLLE